MLLTLDLGVWDEPTRGRSLPHSIPQFSDEAAASCLQSVTQTFLQYASCSPPNLASHLSSTINTPVFASFLACCSASWSRVWRSSGFLCAGKTGIVSEFCWMQEIIDLDWSLEPYYYKDSIFIEEAVSCMLAFPGGKTTYGTRELRCSDICWGVPSVQLW